MALSIYDLLNKDIDYKYEYRKIKDLFLNYNWIQGSIGDKYSYEDVFDAYIMYWKYRGTKCTLKEIIEDIERKTNCGENSIDDCLYLCDLILNIKEFLKYITKKYYLEDMYVSGFNDSMLIETVEFLLKSLGYSWHKEEEYRILLVKNDADSINTAMLLENEDIASLIMQYNDFKIVKDVKEKQRILQSLANYIEPQRSELRAKNSKLEKNLFMAFNKLNIRHNNLNGKYKEEFTSKLTNEELLQWYDRTYSLILYSIRLLELDNQIKPFEDIAKQYFDK